MRELIFRGEVYQSDEVISKLVQFLTPERMEKINNIVGKRSNFFIPVLENPYDRGNVSAVMRSCEAFGFYKIHIIQQIGETFKESKRVTQGADKWLEVKKWSKIKSCVESLKEDGYKVFTTSLSDDAKSFTDIDFSQKTAVIILGNERDGVSREALKLSDGNVLLPMEGFTQSFNISVAAALCFLSVKLSSPPLIDQDEQDRLKALYMLKTLDWSTSVLTRAFAR